MAYSRWSNSRWYTFQLNTDNKKIDEQIFYICSVTQVTYKELKEDFDGTIAKIVEKENSMCHDKVKKWEEIELKSYAYNFMCDIENDKDLEG